MGRTGDGWPWLMWLCTAHVQHNSGKDQGWGPQCSSQIDVCRPPAEDSGSPSSHRFLHSGRLSVTQPPHVRAGLQHWWPSPQEERGEAAAGQGYRERPWQVGCANWSLLVLSRLWQDLVPSQLPLWANKSDGNGEIEKPGKYVEEVMRDQASQSNCFYRLLRQQRLAQWQ